MDPFALASTLLILWLLAMLYGVAFADPRRAQDVSFESVVFAKPLWRALIRRLPESSRTAEHEEQLAVAKEAAKAIIASGAVGDETKGFNIGLSGHGNEDHEPRADWSNDVITVNVSQATAAVEAE